MLPYPVDVAGTGTAPGPFISTPANIEACLGFSPTMRAIQAPSLVDSPSNRQQSVTFAKGYHEKIRLSIQGNTALHWRRMIVSFKCLPAVSGSASPPFGAMSALDPTDGYVRRLTDWSTDSTSISSIFTTIFDGTFGKDWLYALDAKLDRDVIKVHYDRTRTFNPKVSTANLTQGPITSYEFTQYHPLNHTLIYSDDENGITESTSIYASQNPRSMGDLFIFDYFRWAQAGSFSDNSIRTFTFAPQGKYFWHER